MRRTSMPARSGSSSNGVVSSKAPFSSRRFIINLGFLVFFFFLVHSRNDCGTCENQLSPQRTASSTASSPLHGGGGCKALGLPQAMENIPLSPAAYEFDPSNATTNFFVAKAKRDIANLTQGVIVAFPNEPRLLARLSRGQVQVRNNGNIWTRIAEASPEDGAFVDVGGWVGDTSLPSAAAGFDTYVFEPVTANANIIRVAAMANGCRVAEHLTVINALVGDRDDRGNRVYVTAERADNSAGSQRAATLHIKNSEGNYFQRAEMVTLDTFFPPGTRVQNLKVDVQGNELGVLRGARRLLEENRGRLLLRFEFEEDLLRAAGTDPPELLRFVEELGYEMVQKDGSDMDWRAKSAAGAGEEPGKAADG